VSAVNLGWGPFQTANLGKSGIRLVRFGGSIFRTANLGKSGRTVSSRFDSADLLEVRSGGNGFRSGAFDPCFYGKKPCGEWPQKRRPSRARPLW
jgi:hypothetical protein